MGYGSSDGRQLSIYEACEAAGLKGGATVQDDDVTVFGPDERPVRAEEFLTFEEIREFPTEVRHELKRAGFPGPSQIQAFTWPLSLLGKDIIGIAATGSGKTLAFLLPAFCYVIRERIRPDRDGASLLVMAPTRELAQQIEAEANRFGQCLRIETVSMYGGAPKGDQLRKYRYGSHVIVACPGRLNDFLENGQVRVDSVHQLVLDEADRMLDMGFEPQIRKILERVPRKRHTLFFTATWPKEVRRLANEILDRPYKVMIGNRDELKGNQDITQIVRLVEAHEKDAEIYELLREAGLLSRHSSGKALVFCSTKRMCDQLSRSMARDGVPCDAIHGDKDQRQRDDALDGLKRGRVKVLVATDVAARGLDIKGVGLVVNYDPANNTEDYVHRIGRTGRVGKKGFAVTFLTDADAGKARGIVEVMERNNQDIPEELRQFCRGSRKGGGKSRHYGGGGGWGGGARSGGYGDKGAWGGYGGASYGGRPRDMSPLRGGYSSRGDDHRSAPSLRGSCAGRAEEMSPPRGGYGSSRSSLTLRERSPEAYSGSRGGTMALSDVNSIPVRWGGKVGGGRSGARSRSRSLRRY